MAVNWALGVRQTNPLEAFTQAFEQGRERKRQDETRNALMAYAQNPSEQGLNALAQYAPEVAIQERGRFQQQQVAAQEREQEGLQRRLQLVGRVASMADTPEKWDAGVDYLVQQGYSDLAQYKGKFSEEARQAAIAASMDPEKFIQRNQPVNLGPGSMLVDPTTGKTIAQAPFAPRPVTLNPGQTAVEYDPNTPNDPEGIFSRMIHTESRGRQFGANGQPLTSPAGAIGIAQVMPGTAPEAAALAGVPFDENRYRTDPEYNAALGWAYFQKQLADFGDERQAVAAYNAGPGRVRAAVQRGGENWEAFLPAETKGYLQSVFGGGARVIGRGDPKPAPDARGTPPSGYRWKANGELEPIPGGPAAKDSPAQEQAYSQSAMDAFNRAIDSANRLLTHPGFSARVGMPGVTGGLLFGNVIPGTDAADFDAELQAMKAQVFLPMVQSMKGMGALSNAEGEKLTAAIGALDPKMSEGAFKASLNRIIRDLTTYRDRGAPKAASQPRQTGGQQSANRQRLRYDPATGRLVNAN